MSNVFIYVFIFFMVIFGGFSTVYVVLSLPLMIVYKIFRKIKFGENIM